jgi:signal transduction histidine kinase
MAGFARIPLRVRITLAFAMVSATVLIALGLFLHARLRSELDASLQAGLRQRVADLTALVAQGDPSGLGSSDLVERGDDVSQVLEPPDRVVAGAPGFQDAPLLTPAQIARATRRPLTLRVPEPRDEGQLALFAAPADGRVVVAGASLENRDDALSSLDALLLAGIPIAVLLAAGAGYLVAGATLRPLDRMRGRADSIGAQDLSRRLPVPPAEDEVRRLAATLNGMLDRLEEAFRRERTFVADASHELRTPLARLKAELELADRPGRSAEELVEAVRSAASETDHLVMLAEDLLVLARTDQGRLPIRMERVDVREMLHEIQRRYAADAAVQAPPGLVIHADPMRLQQALANLVDNARRHGAGAITLAAAVDESGVTLHVRDEGAGVPPELRPQAFERFTRGDPTRDPDGGAGLGLAIVAAVAQAHGGTAGIAGGATSDVWMKVPR